jgi:hypothetical protein
MGGENHFRRRLLRRCGIDVEAIVFDGDSARLISDAAKFSIKIVTDGSFVAGDGFDVDELASERDGVHLGKRIADGKVRSHKSEGRSQSAEVRALKPPKRFYFCILSSAF